MKSSVRISLCVASGVFLLCESGQLAAEQETRRTQRSQNERNEQLPSRLPGEANPSEYYGELAAADDQPEQEVLVVRKNVRKYLDKVEKRWRAGKTERAVKELNQIYQSGYLTEVERMLALRFFFWMYSELDDVENSIVAGETYLGLPKMETKNRNDLIYGLSGQYIKKSDFVKATALLEEYVDNVKDTPGEYESYDLALVTLGSLHRNSGWINDSLDTYAAKLEIQNATGVEISKDAYLILAVGYAEKSRFKESRQVIEGLINRWNKLDPSNRSAEDNKRYTDMLAYLDSRISQEDNMQ